MLSSTPLIVLRLYELAQVLGTLGGAYMVLRYGKTKFLAGLYAGCVSIFFWDWIFTDAWFLNLIYDDRSINLFTLQGRPEPLWSPCSYATFFGVTTLLVLRYGQWLDLRFGRWKYAILVAFISLLDVVVEGFVITALDVYRYGYRPEWTILGVPYTNILWVNIILLLMIWVSKGIVSIQHDRGILAVYGAPSVVRTPALAGNLGGGAAQPRGVTPATSAKNKEPWLLAALGFSICPTAFYVGIIVMTPLLQAVKPWT